MAGLSEMPRIEPSHVVVGERGVGRVTASTKRRALLLTLSRLGKSLSSFPGLILVLLTAVMYFTCRARIDDPDLWWHLRNAQYLVTSLHLPNFDTYSFTAMGSPWVNHEWLPGLLYYVGFCAFGLRGVFIVFASVIAMLVLALFLNCLKETRDPFVALIATTCGALLGMVGFSPRAQHFGWLCFALVYGILLRFRSSKEEPLWLIPVLFCIWANCHGSWLIGLVIYAIFICAGLVRRDLGALKAAPWSDHDLRRLLLTGLASIGALFVNPFGYRLLLWPFDLAFRQKLGVGNVEEWASVNFGDARGRIVALLLAAIFISAFVGRRRWRIDDALLTMFVLYCGLAHVRFLLLAGIALPPILAPQFGRISSYDPRRERRLLNLSLITITIGICALAFPSERMLGEEVANSFPVRAVGFLRGQPQQGHIFNLYQWGGYLEWNLSSVHTFIDSRSDIFEYNGVLKDYLDVAYLNNSEEILERYGVGYVVYPVGTPLIYLLSKSRQWERIYSDNQTIIYRKVSN